MDLTQLRPGRLTAEQRRSFRAEWGGDDSTLVVGAVGRLVAEKGYPELFEAVAGLDGVRLVVVGGEDPDKPDALDPGVVQRARDAGVVFLGHRDDIARIVDWSFDQAPYFLEAEYTEAPASLTMILFSFSSGCLLHSSAASLSSVGVGFSDRKREW